MRRMQDAGDNVIFMMKSIYGFLLIGLSLTILFIISAAYLGIY